MNYKFLNNITGWSVFIIATVVYILTLEPTTSLWDCGEYITTAYKLEVGHPPGAPLFMMLGRLFTIFVSPENAAYMVNLMSGLSSSFSILFLFWSITMIAKKIVLNKDQGFFILNSNKDAEKKRSLTTGEQIAVLGSGVIGALAYTFTDSFWFSAVEGEVYAMSSFFTALVFWAILKWEAELTEKEENPENLELQEKNENRWLVFIFFMIGLSIGVHLLNLLCIPAIAYVIYFKKFKAEIFGFLLTGVIGVAALAIVQSIIIPYTVNIAGGLERTFVNSFGLPFNSGAITFFLIILCLIIIGLVISRKNSMPILNTGIWSFTMILIGYSCFAMIVIRSNANPPLDENDPENLVSLESYLKREQYGDWPILYGQYYNSELEKDRKLWKDRSDIYLRRWVVQSNDSKKKELVGFINKEDAEKYASENNGMLVEKYYKSFDGKGQKPVYDNKQCTFFPRMYSSEDRHIQGYVSWSGSKPNKLPTFSENLTYFTSYQINWMYWRYFMWNFSGRQTDEQGHGNARDGNWISGINFIDKHHVGSQKDLPSVMANNPSHNKFYLLPLILGIIGLIFTIVRANKAGWIIFLLFVLTGFAIIIYLNQKPIEPRERDYAYAGSFYAFSMWIGLSVLGLYEAFKRFTWLNLLTISGVLLGLSVVLFAGGITTGLTMLYMSFVITLAFGLMILLKSSLKKEMHGAVIATLICIPVPIIMGMEGWDDHDRSNRYTAQALAYNYLISCSDNSIVFTNGDNDTFPLWYLQEVEGVKTSVRVCNLSLLNTDWYTMQMKRRAYDSAPLPISFEEHQYRQNLNLDYMYVTGTNEQTLGTYELDASNQKLLQLKIDSNPELFAAAFKKASDNLYLVLSNSILAQNQPDVVNKIKGFNETGSYFSFRKFCLDIINSGEKLGMAENQLNNVQNILIEFNDGFDYLPVQYVMEFLKDDKNLYDGKFFVIPSKGLSLKIDKNKIIEKNHDEIEGNEIVNIEDEDRIVDVMRWKIPKNVIYKADLLILDMVANFDWDRNLYFASSAAPSTYMGLENYFYAEGLVYKLVPIKINRNKNPNSLGEINKIVMYDNVINKYQWGNMEKEGVLVDYYTRRLTNNYRVIFSVLADAFVEDYEFNNKKIEFLNQIVQDSNATINQDTARTPIGNFAFTDIPNEIDKSKKLMEEAKVKTVATLDKSFEIMPADKVPYGRIIPYYITAYYSVGEIEKAELHLNEALMYYQEEMDYYLSVDEEFSGSYLDEMFGVYRSIFTLYQATAEYSDNEAINSLVGDVIFDYMKKIEMKSNKYTKAGHGNLYNETFGNFFNQIKQFLGAAA